MRLLLEAVADKEYFNVLLNPLLSRFSENFTEKMLRYAVNLITFVKLPSVLFSHGVMKAVDANQIHPEKLCGKMVSELITLNLRHYLNRIAFVVHRELIGFTSLMQMKTMQAC